MAWRSLWLVGLTGAAVIGCNAIAGIDEAKLDPISDPTGPGSGSGGTIGLPPPSAPADGCGSENLVVPEELIEGCLMRVSCDPIHPRYTMSSCVTFARQEMSLSELCTLYADSCETVDACLLRGYEDYSAECLGVESQWTCDGDVAIRCGINATYHVDCEGLGAECVEGSNSELASVGGCRPTSSTFDCSSAAEGEAFCVGDEIHFCSDGGSRGYDCSFVGETCIETEPGQAYCGAEIIECDTPSQGACVEGGIAYCFDNGTFDYFDCSVAELSCSVEDDGSNAYCLAEGCTPDDVCEEQCVDDTRMQFCLGGTPIIADCRGYGFDACGSGTHGDGSTYVACYDD